jgi:hypothetical protein
MNLTLALGMLTISLSICSISVRYSQEGAQHSRMIQGLDTTAFFQWWDTTEYHNIDHVRHPQFEFVVKKLIEMVPDSTYILYKPENFKAKEYEVYKIADVPHDCIVIVVPLDTGLSESSREPLGQQADSSYFNFSLLGLTKKNYWCKVDLNPNHSEVYYYWEDVRICLYWFAEEEYPLIAINTNQPACTPNYLFYFDKRLETFKLVRQKCTG